MGNVQILRKQLESPDEETRRLAVAGLTGHAVEEARECLYLALGDASWRVRKEAVELVCASPLSQEMIEELITMLRSQDNAGLRNSAVEVLVRLGARVAPILFSAVNDPDHDVRKFIIDIMGSIGDSSFVPILLLKLADDDRNVSAAAVENLGKIGDQRAVEPLLQLLEKPDTWLRYAILEALARIGRPAPVAAIAPLAQVDLLKRAVYECLGNIGDADGVSVLLAGLRDRGKTSREAALCALERIRERLPAELVAQSVDAGLKELRGEPVVEALVESLSASDPRVRRAAIRILGITGDERAAGALLHGCGDDRLRSCCLQAFKAMGGTVACFFKNVYADADASERCVIAYLCGEMGLRECADLLGMGLRDPRSEVRKEALLACGKLGLTGFTPDIAELLHDCDPDIREAAIVALARLAELDGPRIVLIAESLASAENMELRRDSAYLFGALRDVEKLFLLMKDEDAEVRKVAVSALADLKIKESAGQLLMALVDEDPEVRIAAASALDETVGEAALDPLLLLLRDDDQWVQCAALKGLGKLKGEKAIQAIESVFDTASGAVMIAAIEALGCIGGPRACKLLERALDDDDEEVVKTAFEQMARCGGDWLEKGAGKLLFHPDWGVRSCCVRIISEFLGNKSLSYLERALTLEKDDLVRGQIKVALERFR